MKLRLGDYIFIGLALIFLAMYVIGSTVLSYPIDEAIAELIGYELFFVGVPWFVYNYISNKRLKQKNTQT